MSNNNNIIKAIAHKARLQLEQIRKLAVAIIGENTKQKPQRKEIIKTYALLAYSTFRHSCDSTARFDRSVVLLGGITLVFVTANKSLNDVNSIN